MSYDKFTILRSTAVPLPIENVDTDQIIPARFLKATERKGFGDNLFRDWRYDKQGNKLNDFTRAYVLATALLVRQFVEAIEAAVIARAPTQSDTCRSA